MSILAARRSRELALARNLFSDPAWDILLELYAAKLGSRRMDLSDLARSIEIPESAAIRWVNALSKEGLVTSSDVECDSPLLWIDLSETGERAMKRLFDYWDTAFRSI